MTDAHLERLLAELSERARADIIAVETECSQQVDALRAAQRERARQARARAMADCEQAAARESADAVAALKRQHRGALLGTQHALVDRALQRVRGLLAERLAQCAQSAIVARRVNALREYASSPDVEVSVSGAGITLEADSGHLRIDDTVDAWLAAERPRLAIDICRLVEPAKCPSQRP